VLEDGAFGDSQGSGYVAYASIVISTLCEVLRRRFYDARALSFRTRPQLRLALVERRHDPIAGDSRHH